MRAKANNTPSPTCIICKLSFTEMYASDAMMYMQKRKGKEGHDRWKF